jgi:hypothetical protein
MNTTTILTSATHSSKLKPFPCGKGIGLSFYGRIFRRCECNAYFVEPKVDNYITIWLCKTCGKPRLAQRRKLHQELIAELLGHPDLKGWDKLFCTTHAKTKNEKLASWQQQKVEGIARKLGIAIECNCAISELEGGKS